MTGTAAWTFLNVSQYILGIRPDYDGLIIDPCIPNTLDGFHVSRDFRGIRYEIEVKNPHHVEKGIHTLIVNGVPVEGIKIPLTHTGTVVHVEAVMG